MVRRSFFPALFLALTLLVTGQAEENTRLKDVLALQEAMEQIIERAEPSIACILVSRSDGYGAVPSADSPGKLGKFDARPSLGGSSEQDEKRRKQILAL